jgi:hypothetical protein
MRAAAPEEASGASTANHYDRSSCSHALFASDNQAANVTAGRRNGVFESHAFAQSKDNKMMMKDHPAARALRQANKLFKQVDTTKELSDYEKTQQSFQENRERLKAERLAREARSRSRPE